MKVRPLKLFTPIAIVGMVAPAVADLMLPASMTQPDGEGLWFILGAAAVELVCLLSWCFVAVSNVHALGVKGLRFTPFTALAWWIIPFANLYMPYRALAEAWRASDPATFGDGTQWRNAPGPRALLSWWVLSILSIIAMSPDPIWRNVGLTCIAMSIACFVVAAIELSRRQEQCARSLSYGTSGARASP